MLANIVDKTDPLGGPKIASLIPMYHQYTVTKETSKVHAGFSARFHNGLIGDTIHGNSHLGTTCSLVELKKA